MRDFDAHLCYLFVFIYIFTAVRVSVCVLCAICELTRGPICGLETDDWPGLVPPPFSICITCLPLLFLPTRLSVLQPSGPFVVLWGGI